MARTARNKNYFSGVIDALKGWARENPDELKLGILTGAVAFFFTHGLPLWNEDYSQYLAQVRANPLGVLFQTISPVASQAPYAEHPLQALIYGILHLAFGYWGTGFYLVKSIVFGALSIMMYRSMRGWGVERYSAALAIAAFTFTTSAVTSVVVHSDFSVYSQLLIVTLLFWSLEQIEKAPSNFSVYSKGVESLPKPFASFLLTFFLATYFGSKITGDVRIVPLVLLAYTYTYRRQKFEVLAPAFAVTLLASLPWSSHVMKTITSFNVMGVIRYLTEGMTNIHQAPNSVFAAFGLLLVLGAVVYGGYQVYREKLETPDDRWGLLLVWSVVGVLACGYVPSDVEAGTRFALAALVPMTLIFGMICHRAIKDFPKAKFVPHLALALVALQAAGNLYQDVKLRRDIGSRQVAFDKTNKLVEEKFANAAVYQLPGFTGYGYRASDVPAIKNQKPVGDELKNAQPGGAYLVGWESSLDTRLALESSVDGCANSAFDKIFGCYEHKAAVMKFIGTPNEVAQADALDKQGNLAGARQVLDGYLQREPNNHGVAFVAGVYAYRASDHTRMEQLYDYIGPYFPGHSTVVYNWGLAKQGVQKFAEASRLFETAFSMVPRDYAIGFNLADAYYRSGNKSRAIATLKDLIQVYPGSEPMKNAYKEWSK